MKEKKLTRTLFQEPRLNLVLRELWSITVSQSLSHLQVRESGKLSLTISNYDSHPQEEHKLPDILLARWFLSIKGNPLYSSVGENY